MTAILKTGYNLAASTYSSARTKLSRLSPLGKVAAVGAIAGAAYVGGQALSAYGVWGLATAFCNSAAT